MRRVVVDASALVALVFREPGFETIQAKLDGATVFAPELLKFELASAAVAKARLVPGRAPQIFGALALALEGGAAPIWRDVDPTDVALIAGTTGLTAYDASYLWLAGFLEADLVTLDRALSRAIGSETEHED